MRLSPLYTLLFTALLAPLVTFSQKFVEPGKQDQFNITVNHDDYTVKTQILSHNKDIKVNNDRTYMWYTSQKIMETKGGFEGKLIHGKYNAFYLNNQLKEQGTIKYGLKNKEWKYWYPDGKLKEVITWKNGVKHGPYSLYNDYGQIMAKGSFCNDKLDGKFTTYGPAGNVTETKKYKEGVEVPAKVKKSKNKKTNRVSSSEIENEKQEPKDKKQDSEGKKSKSEKKKTKKTETKTATA